MFCAKLQTKLKEKKLRNSLSSVEIFLEQNKAELLHMEAQEPKDPYAFGNRGGFNVKLI